MSEDEIEVRPITLLASTESDARLAEKNKRGEQAVLGWVKATAVARIVHGDGHWRCAQCHVRTARCYLDLQDLMEQAQVHAVKARDILQVYSRSTHPNHLQAIYSLSEAHYIIGRTLTRKGSFEEAEKSLVKAEAALNQFVKSGGKEEDSTFSIRITWAMGALCTKQKKLDLAKMLILKALEASKTSGDTEVQELVIPLTKELADLEILRGDPHEAIRLLLQIEEKLSSNSEHDTISQAEVSLRLSKAYIVLHREEEDEDAIEQAEEHLLKAHAIYSSQRGPAHFDSLACQDLQLKLLLQTSRNAEAIELLTEMLPLKAVAFGEGHVQLARAWKSLASLLLLDGNFTKATNLLKKAKPILIRELGASHTESVEVTSTLDALFRNSSELKKPRFETVFRTVNK